MKGLLDDAVLASVEALGGRVDYTFPNLKMALGFISIAVALVPQVYPSPFKPMPWPESRLLTFVCVTVYGCELRVGV